MGDKILVTGITGNVGSEVARFLELSGVEFKGAVRNVEKSREQFPNTELVAFDFGNESTYDGALRDVNKVFLIRPPQIADAKTFIKPFIEKAKNAGIEQIVFLSLMGIEKNPVPPHYKIEKYIRESGIPYTFLRPSFFMQNLNTTHCYDIKERNDIFIPCGKAKVSFIDTRDIGEVGAKVLMESGHENKGYTLTGGEAIDYYKVAEIFSEVLDREIKYTNPSPLKFRKVMINRGVKKDFVNVMVALYVTTRMGMAKQVTPELERLLGRKPTTIRKYVEDYSKEYFI